MIKLPIHEVSKDLLSKLNEHKVILLSAPTGSGKSTCVPGILRDSGQFEGKIIVVQPRRAAAKFLALYTAKLRNCIIGDEVAYSVRHDSKVSANSKIVFMTDGLFLQQLKNNPQLIGISAVLFDEFHERRWQMDLALAICRKTLEINLELKLLVMSATLDVEKLKTSLNCPVISTEVRNFPVSIQYHHPDRHKKIWEFAAQHAKKLMSSIEGSLLIFMPGKYEINKTINELSKFHPRSKILALHGQLPTSEQDRVIKNAENNRIIVATNIAETSLTIPGITAVIDSGTIKQSSYDSSRQLTTLYTQPISTSSADQRAGRAGRIAPGQCIRLWSKSEQNRRPSHFEPEILRCDPAELLLQSYAHGYPDPKLLPLLDLPSHFERATDTLKSLGFLNQNLTLSAAGQCAATMPCSPHLAAILYYGTQADQMIKACAYAALISEPSIILSKVKKNISDLALDENKTYSSDLDILHELLSLARDLKFNPDSCTKYGLNANNCRNVNLARQQFLNICESLPRLHDFNDMHPHCCLLRAFRDRIAKRRDSGSLQVDLSEDRKGEIERLSSQKKSEIILAAEIADIAGVMGSKTRLSLITSVSKELLEHTFPKKLKIDFVVKWDQSTKSAVCAEQLKFDNLILSEKFKPAEPCHASEELLSNKILDGTIRLNKWSEKVNNWIKRVQKCSEIYPEKGLIKYNKDEIKIVYMEMCVGLTRASQLKDLDCLPYVKNLLNWDEQCFVDKAMPEFITLSDGKKLRIFYEEGKEIYTRAFIQQLFDLKTTPLIGPAKIPLTFEILAPNHRPIQVTKSLENFWTKLYPEIKPSLSRRYHKHKWI